MSTMTDTMNMHTIGLQLADYLMSPPALVAVLIPGISSLIILLAYAKARRISGRLWLLWALCLPATYWCGQWVDHGGLHELYLVSIFSVASLLLLFRKKRIPPMLIYAMTYLSLGIIDTAKAFFHALDFELPIRTFYYGVGGAGVGDALFIVPLATATFAAYAAKRLRATRAAVVDF